MIVHKNTMLVTVHLWSSLFLTKAHIMKTCAHSLFILCTLHSNTDFLEHFILCLQHRYHNTEANTKWQCLDKPCINYSNHYFCRM